MTHPISSSKLIHWIHNIQALFQLFRPFSAVIATAAGCVAVYSLNPALPLQSYLLTGFVLACMTAAACAINDYWDIDKDRINHLKRPLPSGRLSLQQAWWSAIILFASALIAAIPLGLYAFLLVAVSTVLLWYYSLLLNYSGILGNFLVATIVALLLLLSSLVADRPFALLYPIGFLFYYALAREILLDIHDAEGDRVQGVATVANVWGKQTAFLIIWVLIAVLFGSIPTAIALLAMSHPFWFASCTSIMLLTLVSVLIPYQRQNSDITYRQLLFWERIGMVFGVVGLLGTSPS